MADYQFVTGSGGRKYITTMIVYTCLLYTSLEVDGVSQIFTLFKNVADGGRTPAVHIFEGLIFVHALAVPGKVSGRHEDFFFFQLAGDLIPVSYTHLDVYKRQRSGCHVLSSGILVRF